MNERTESQRARMVTVGPDEAGRRLDNFLLTRLGGVPRSRVYRMIRGGEVRVNKGRARASRRLAAGDEVRIPPVRSNAPGLPPVASRARRAEEWIIHEDRELLALNKPAGIAAHGGSGISAGLIELLRAARPAAPYLELVHRLDRDTSGVMLVARRRSALRRLHEALREGGVEKHYLALLHGIVPAGGIDCDLPLLTTARRGGERHVRTDPAGKPARTVFEPLESLPGGTLCAVRLYTGRTHQVRAHAAALGHPLAGDTRYGPGDDALAAAAGIRRLFLHAARLAFEHPGGGGRLEVEAPLDARLAAGLERLRDMQRSAG